MVGAEFVDALVTEIVNAGRLSESVPSLTRITMLPNVPVEPGVPERRPVVVLKVAHDGLFWMLKASVLPSGSEAEGWKLYACPTFADVTGVPLIVGARLVVDVELEVTVMVNSGRLSVARPSLTVMRMLEYLPM